MVSYLSMVVNVGLSESLEVVALLEEVVPCLPGGAAPRAGVGIGGARMEELIGSSNAASDD